MNKIAIVSTSHKVQGNSSRVAVCLSELINDNFPNCSSMIIPLENVPFWDEGKWGKPELSEKWAAWKPIADTLSACDALIAVTPEYGGMMAPRLSNFMLLCSGKEIGHKPALAVAVSSARGGAYPISQLRAYSSKNNQVCWIPSHLIIRNLENEGDPLPEGSYEREFALYCLVLLDAYATALKSVRQSGVINQERYPYGM